MSNPFAQLAWVVTVIIAMCFVSNLLSRGSAFSRSLALALLLWALYGFYETFYIDFPRINIRVDLLVIFPVLAITTIIGLVRWIKG
jgi:hypothetical protein